jgi:hypothetical protein
MMMQNCWSMLELPRDEEGGTIDLADVQAAALQHAHNVEMQMGDPTVHRGALFAAGNDRTVDPTRGRRCLRSIAESNDLEHDELPGAPLRSSYMHMRMGMRLGCTPSSFLLQIRHGQRSTASSRGWPAGRRQVAER